MYIKLTIPERLKDLRVERGLTLEQLAEATGLSKSALGKYEADDFKDISPFSIATLAKFYGVSTDYLMGLTETKNRPNTDLHDLHLSDDMITVLGPCLKNGQYTQTTDLFPLGCAIFPCNTQSIPAKNWLALRKNLSPLCILPFIKQGLGRRAAGIP